MEETAKSGNSDNRESPFSAGVILPEVEPEDYPEIRSRAAAIWPVAYGELISKGQIEYMLDRMYSDTAIGEDVANGIHYRWITVAAVREGFLAFGPVMEGQSCPLHKLYLGTERQGRGIGSAAMRCLRRELVNAGVTGIELRVNRENRKAIRFYERNGFAVARGDCLDIGGGYVMDDFIMVRPL